MVDQENQVFFSFLKILWYHNALSGKQKVEKILDY